MIELIDLICWMIGINSSAFVGEYVIGHIPTAYHQDVQLPALALHFR
jgi:hypothetical protein